jgi:cyclohexyl-isocyanide hydratase
VLSRVPGAKTHLVAKDLTPVASDTVLTIQPTTTFADCPQLDVICVPGGVGTDALLNDEETLAFLRKQAKTARYVTSVCTGSLILGAAGLLKGRRAACHWAWRDMLGLFGAIADPGRVVRDGDIITGGGVTAGIDFALVVAAELAGEAFAQAIQLGIEYAPAPPFDAGRPETAPPAVLAAVQRNMAALLPKRRADAERAAARL